MGDLPDGYRRVESDMIAGRTAFGERVQTAVFGEAICRKQWLRFAPIATE